VPPGPPAAPPDRAGALTRPPPGNGQPHTARPNGTAIAGRWAPIEIRFKALCAYASEMVVYGENRPYCTALVALDPEPVAAWARAHGLGHLSLAELAAHERLRALIADAVEEVNRPRPPWQAIRRFAVLPRELTVEEGDVTLSLKLRRQVVTEQHRDLLDSLYDKPSVRATG
jgi:long-chain acyl-CoA synthetase